MADVAWETADDAADALQRWLWNTHRISPEASIVKAIRAVNGRIELRCQINPAAERHAAELPKIFEGYFVQYQHWDGATSVTQPVSIGRNR